MFSARQSRSRFRELVLVVVFAMLATACGTEAVDSGAIVVNADGSSVSDAAGELGPVETSDGNSFAFASLDNKPTVVWFWGPG